LRWQLGEQVAEVDGAAEGCLWHLAAPGADLWVLGAAQARRQAAGRLCRERPVTAVGVIQGWI